MGSVKSKRWTALGALLLVNGLLIGCATEGGSALRAKTAFTADGLVNIPSRSGALFIKPEHNIAGYDQIFLEPISISYVRGREALEAKEEAALLEALERGERERAEQAGISLASARSHCAMSMKFYIVDLELTPVGSSSGSQTIFVASLGTVTLVADIRDSRSGMALLRFAQRRRIVGGEMPGPPDAVAMSRLKETLNAMLADFGAELLAVIPRSRPQPPVSPECKGALRAIGDAAGAR